MPPTRKPVKVDKCSDLRKEIAQNNKDIMKVRATLGEPDLPRSVIARLKALLKQLLALQVSLAGALRRCEAIPNHPALKG